MKPDKNPIFHPFINEWFYTKYQNPSDIQKKAWPLIATGDHVLISAPTGTGKTLTAFLWALNKLITGEWISGSVRVLYISPLKALNTDIRENLLLPLHEIRQLFVRNGIELPTIRVVTRSGDTPLGDRRNMQRHPPEILITTPESLNLILNSPRARNMFTGLKTVILDEIHAIASDKRGVYLMSAIERLTLLSGEFQRIALSATVHPLQSVANFTGGLTLTKSENSIRYTPRPVSIVSSTAEKKIEIRIEGMAKNYDQEQTDDSLWRNLATRIRQIVDRNRATLVFVNNRRLAERLSLFINEFSNVPYAYSHHGSLSREIRQDVEKKLKCGELKAIVATSSLEMGIDVGAIDEVILVQTPPFVASTLQRIGRAGHSVDRVSQATIMPIHGMDYLYSAIVASMAKMGDIEEVRLIYNPLDILAQLLLSMTGIEPWDIDELYDFVLTITPFSTLQRKQFDSVLMMLNGKYEDSRIRELNRRVIIDPIENRVYGRDGILSMIYMSGGTIPNRGYYGLRIQGSDALIGELDEEFVWERRTGDTFVLGTQNWRIEEITEKDVKVVPWNGAVSMSPFWKAEGLNRSFHVSNSLLQFLERWNDHVATDEFVSILKAQFFMDETAALSLSSYLQLQKQFTGPVLPHRHHLIAEHVFDSDSGLEPFTVLHTMWGNTINYPFMLCLSCAYEKRYKKVVDMHSTNDSIYIGTILETDELLSLFSKVNIEDLLQKKLENSNYFGARFRENAGRALLLPVYNRKWRMPFWITRRRAKELFSAVQRYADFPMTIETWRCCFKDDFNLDALTMLLDELSSGEIQVSSIKSSCASPFSGGIKWQMTNKFLYEDDTPDNQQNNSAKKQDAIKDAVLKPANRPDIDITLAESIQKRLQRTLPDYAPSGTLELIDWIRERVCIPVMEWKELLDTIKVDNRVDLDIIYDEYKERICKITFPGAKTGCIAAIDSVPHILVQYGLPFTSCDITTQYNEELSDNSKRYLKKTRNAYKKSVIGETPEDRFSFVAHWLMYYGPVHRTILNDTFGLSVKESDFIIDYLKEQETLVDNIAIPGEKDLFICDTENYERLLRIIRKSKIPSFKPYPLAALQLFIATIQGLTESHEGTDSFNRILVQLEGYPGKVSQWERDIFPTRITNYQPWMIDSALMLHNLQWFGCGKHTIAFCYKDDSELFMRNCDESKSSLVFPDTRARYSYTDLMSINNKDSETFCREIWKNIWAGQIACDSFEVLRKGELDRYGEKSYNENSVASTSQASDRHPYMKLNQRENVISFDKWRATRLYPGNWYKINYCTIVEDPFYKEELKRERIRVLLKRYGIIFRELLFNETIEFQWSALFQTLRIMELSGEILSGHFFEGITGIQFISASAFSKLQKGLPADALYWMNATDPSSLCGIGIDALKATLTERIGSSHLIFHGQNLVIISKKSGAAIECKFTEDCTEGAMYCSMLKKIPFRTEAGGKPLRIETINGEQVLKSAHTRLFIEAGFLREYKYLVNSSIL